MFPRNAPAGYLNVNGDLAFTKPKSRVLIYAGGNRAELRTIFTAPPGQNAVFGAMPGPGGAVAVIQVYGSNLDSSLANGFRYGDLRAGGGFITLTSASLNADSGAGAVPAPTPWPLRFNVNGIITQIGIDGSWSFNGGKVIIDAAGNVVIVGGCTAPAFEVTNFLQFDGPAAANQFRMSYNTPAPTYQLVWNFNGGPTLMTLDKDGTLAVTNLAIVGAGFSGHEVLIGSAPFVGGVTPAAAGTVLTSNGPSAHPTFQSVAAAGAMVRLQQVVCAGSQNVVNFTPPAGFSNLVIMYQARDTTAGTSDSNVFIRFNGDATAANYDTPEAIVDNGSTLARASPAVSVNGFAIVTIPNNGALAGRAGIGQINIPNYGGGFFKQAQGWSSESFSSNASPLASIYIRHGEWRSTAPIASIDLIANTAFLNNSVFTLYGMP
jgi:hypothetical protein